MSLITIDRVGFAFHDEAVLADISLNIAAGDFICLLGPSGCGKSTLLRLLAGLESPQQGQILFQDAPLQGPSLKRGMVFQDYSLFPWMSTGENILLALRRAQPDQTKAELRRIAQHFLTLVGLPGVYGKRPMQLSGGMRQRAAIARAFAIDPPVLLMDEPFGALDAINRATLQNLLLDLWRQDGQQQKTIVFVTHDVDEAILLADKIVVMSSHPGTIKAVFEPQGERRQRRDNLYQDASLIALRNELLRILHEYTVNGSGETITC